MPQDFSFATWALCTDTTFGAPPYVAVNDKQNYYIHNN